MSTLAGYPDPSDYLTQGVMLRRCVAWLFDAILIGLLVFGLWWLMVVFSVVTLGLGAGSFAILPLVPFLYHFLSLLSSATATPGQRAFGVIVRRDFDLGPPTALQALISVIAYYVTLATSGLLLLIALFTTRHRTLHDLLSGLVVVRVDAMRTLTAPEGFWNMASRS